MLADISEIISQSFKLYRGNLATMLLYGLLFLLLTPMYYILFFIVALVYGILLFSVESTWLYLLITIVLVLGSFILAMAVQNAVTISFFRRVQNFLGKTPSHTLPVKSLIFPGILLNILVGLVMFGGPLLLIILGFIFDRWLVMFGGALLLIIPSIIFVVWFCFAMQELIYENKRGVKALSSSKDLVAGRWWTIFVRLIAPPIVFAVAFMAVYMVMGLLFGLIPSDMARLILIVLANIALSIVFVPLLAIPPIVLYFSARENPTVTAPTAATSGNLV